MLGRTITLTALTGLALAPVALSAKPDPGEYTLALTAPSKPVVFTTPAAVAGTLTGPDAAGVSVTLEEDSTLPLGDKFAPSGEKATTAADGKYSFAITPSVTTQYRTVAKTSPNTESMPVLVKVAPRVDVTVSDRTPSAGARVLFSGAVLPARDGATALVQRRRSGAWKTVGRATLTDAGEDQSAYAKRIRIRKDGTYRVKVAKDAQHVAGVSSRQKVNAN